MKHPRIILALLFVGILSVTAALQQKGGSDDFGPYKPVDNWLKPPRAGFFERGASVFAETPNKIFVTADLEFPMPAAGGGGGAGAPAAPAAPPQLEQHFVWIVDGNGNLLEEWKQWNHLFKMPHAVRISPYDPEKNVWIIDRDNSQIFKFSNDGKKLLLTLGEKGVIQSDDTHFGRPADIAFLPDGTFFVADGYANKRVIKFDKNAKRLLTWGTEGSGPGQFAGQVHDVAVDAKRRVYVGDRGNTRVQIFDENGKFLDEWRDIRGPSYIHITDDGFVWVVCGVGNRLAKYDMNGKLLTYWGMYGTFQGGFDDPHNLSVDSDGNLYVSIYSTRKVGIEKYVPRPDADRTRLVGRGFNRTLPLRNTTR